MAAEKANLKTIILYPNIDRETLYEKGRGIGLIGDVLHFFTFFTEIKIIAVVNIDTGKVVSWEKSA